MAEEKQEDLSMEDILSSIKDILDKDAEGQAGNAASATAPVPPQTPAPFPLPNLQLSCLRPKRPSLNRKKMFTICPKP